MGLGKDYLSSLDRLSIMKSARDQGRGFDEAFITRYLGAQRIRGLTNDGQYMEAYVHTQLAIERILWDKIVGVFANDGNKASEVRRAIDNWEGRTSTHELIKWVHLLGAVNNAEYSDLVDFNKKRNDLMHVHGKWWFSETEHKEALQKGIRFLEKNGML